MDASPFGKLPPELRNRIYELSFSQSPRTLVLRDNSKGRSSTTDRQRKKPKKSAAFPALIQICRAIRQESTQLYYANVRLDFHAEGATQARALFARFRKSIGKPNASALRTVGFRLSATLADFSPVEPMKILSDLLAMARLARSLAGCTFTLFYHVLVPTAASGRVHFYATFRLNDLDESCVAAIEETYAIERQSRAFAAEIARYRTGVDVLRARLNKEGKKSGMRGRTWL